MATNVNADLANRFVLVHPNLEHDPAGKQNEMGMIISADIAKDDFYVSFQDNTSGLYASDALFLLKPVDEIHQLLVDHGALLSFPDLKAFTHLDLTLRYGTGDKEWNALRIAADNPNIQPFSLDLLKETLFLNQAQTRKR